MRHERDEDFPPAMNSWDLGSLEPQPRSPEILSSKGDARAIALEIPEGGELKDHQVHEWAWVTVVEGEVEFTTARGETVAGGCGLMVQFEPGERHAVRARRRSRLLLLLTPWPGRGHPGTMSLEDKAVVRERAAEKAGG